MSVSLKKQTDEEWRPIPGYAGYEACNLGLIRKIGSKEILKAYKTGILKKQYLSVCFYFGNKKKRKQERVHRLILLAYKGNPLPGQVGCHIDDNQLNNNIYNLKWDTQKSNMADSKINGSFYRNHVSGENHYAIKLLNKDIIEIKDLKKYGFSQNKIANIYNVHPSNISKILRGHRRVL